jgi:hypothetical protein
MCWNYNFGLKFGKLEQLVLVKICCGRWCYFVLFSEKYIRKMEA